MSRKTMITLGGVAASVLLVASLALAHGDKGGGGWGHGPGMMRYWNASNLTPEQTAQMNKLRSEYYNDTAAVRGQTVAKHAELQALLTNPDAKSEQISAKQREILQLRTQFGEKRIAYEAKLRNVLTKEQLTQMATDGGCGYGRGWGHHQVWGRGPGMGPGPGYHHDVDDDGPGPGPNPEQP